MSQRKPPQPIGKTEASLVRSSAAEYLTFVARRDRVRQLEQNVGWGVSDDFNHFWSEAGWVGAE